MWECETVRTMRTACPTALLRASLAALASHVRHLILVQELRAVVSSIPNVSAEDH